MLAAVYHGQNDVRLQTVAVPEIGAGELLIRVHTCGICGTDLKKISTGSHSAPRIFGHETAGVVASVGKNVTQFKPGDRVMVFHHIPCGQCYYCRHKTFAQCETYKKVGCTAGFEPSGGGFAEYVRVMDWIVEQGTVRIPDAFRSNKLLRRAGKHLYEGRGKPTPGCGRDRTGDRAGADWSHFECFGEADWRSGNYFRFVFAEAYNI